MKRDLFLLLAFALLMLPSRMVAAQSATDDSVSEQVPGALRTVPFTRFQAFAAGSITTTSNISNCPDVPCLSALCNSCGTFSGLPINGLPGATLSGELILETGIGVGFSAGSCRQLHGIAMATEKQFTIKFGVQGWACSDPTLSPDHLQFTGNYVVLSGTGSYGHATGTGSFTTDYPGSPETVTRGIVLEGVIQKAR